MNPRKRAFLPGQGELFPTSNSPLNIRATGAKVRKFGEDVLRRRLNSIKAARERRIASEEEASFKAMVIGEFSKKFGSPSSKNIRSYLRALDEAAVKEARIADSFKRTGVDSDLVESHTRTHLAIVDYRKFLAKQFGLK